MPEIPAEHLLSPHARTSHTSIDVADNVLYRTAAPCRLGPITLEDGMTCSERIIGTDQSRARHNLAHQRLDSDSCVAALNVWVSQHRKSATVADDAMPATGNYARARPAKRPIWQMRLCATEVLSS